MPAQPAHWLRRTFKYPVVRFDDLRRFLEGLSSSEIDAAQARMNPHQVHPDDAKKYQHLVVQNYWTERPLGDDWTVAYRYTVQNGQPVISELRIFPAEGPLNFAGQPRRAGAWGIDLKRFGGPGHWWAELLGSMASAPPGGLTASLVDKGLHMGTDARLTRQELVRLRRAAPQLFAAEGWEPFTAVSARAALAGRRPGRKGHGLAFFAQLAKEYAERLDAGDPQPNVTIANRRGKTPGWVRDKIFRTRERGLLSPPPAPGKRGGALTPKAEAILKQAEREQRRKGSAAATQRKSHSPRRKRR